jgi:hypothetical protein
MSHRVNSEGFRLGISRFWKSELFSSYVSNFTQKFLAIYLLVKKKLNSFFFKVIFFKIIFLRGQKILILVNTYRLIKRITNSNRRTLVPFNSRPTGKFSRARGVVKFSSARHKKTLFKRVLLSKIFPSIYKQKLRAVPTGGKGLFSVNRINFLSFNLKLEQFLAKLVCFPIEVRLKSIFSLKTPRVLKQKRSVSVLSLCRIIYKKTKNFWKLNFFLYLKDAINILSLSFFYHKSELLANYLADIVRHRRKFFFELKNFKSLLPYFKSYYFLVYGSSLKINVLGKIFGQRKRRFRCFTIKEGLKFSTQDARVNLSYSLAHSWNIFGSFGIKVWIYKSIIKNVALI